MTSRIRTSPPSVLVLPAGDSTIHLGPPGAWGMEGLGSITVLNRITETHNDRDALHTLERLKGDSWQVSKLRDYLASPPLTNYSVRTSQHDTKQVFDTLHHHLRSHRLVAIVTRNHDRHAVPSSARRGAAQAKQAAALPAAVRPTPVSTPAATPAPAARIPANIAGWSNARRVEALLTDTLPLLGPELRAHVQALLTVENARNLAAGFLLMAGLQAIPGVGEAADVVFLGMALEYAGWSGLQAIVHLVRAVTTAIRAGSATEIAAAAPGASDALITLGGDFLDVLVFRMAKRNTSGGGEPAAEPEVAPPTVNSSRGKGVGAKTSTTEAAAPIQWPPNRGFQNDPTNASLPEGYRVSRYGGFIDQNGNFKDLGTFVAPEDVPYNMRALAVCRVGGFTDAAAG